MADRFRSCRSDDRVRAADAPRRFRRLPAALVLACCLVALGAQGAAAISCKPRLSIRNVREIRASAMPIVPWTWQATIVVDMSYCATRSGSFEMDFIRIKENSADLQFTEKFRWTEGQFDVSMELAADESILEYRIGFIAPCVCRELQADD